MLIIPSFFQARQDPLFCVFLRVYPGRFRQRGHPSFRSGHSFLHGRNNKVDEV